MPYILSLITDFGIGQNALRDLQIKNWKKEIIISSSFIFCIFRVGISFLLTLLAFFFLKDRYLNIDSALFFIGALQIIPLIIFNTFLPILFGLGLTIFYNFILVFSSLFTLVILAIFFFFSSLDVKTASLIQIFSNYAISIPIFYYFFNKYIYRKYIDLKYIKQSFSYSKWLTLFTFSNILNNRFIWIVLNKYAGVASVGVYTIAQIFSDRLSIILEPVSSIIYRYASGITNSANKKTNLTLIAFRAVTVAVIFLACIISVFSNFIIVFIFSENFLLASDILRLLLISSIFIAGWTVFSQDLIGQGYGKKISIIFLAVSIIGSLISILLVKSFGLVGAGYSAILYSLILFTSSILFYKAVENLRFSEFFKLSQTEIVFLRNIKFYSKTIVSYFYQLFRAYFMDKLIYKYYIVISYLYRRAFHIKDLLSARLLRSPKLQPKKFKKNHDFIYLQDILASKIEFKSIKRVLEKNNEVILGHFDHFGNFKSNFGRMNYLNCLQEESLNKRRKSTVHLVCNKYYQICIKKFFIGQDRKVRFYKEFIALNYLADKNVSTPKILSADFSNLILVTQFIGPDFHNFLLSEKREILPNFHVNIKNQIELRKKKNGNYLGYIRFMRSLIAPHHRNLIDKISSEYLKIHENMVILNDIKYGNVAIHLKTKIPYIIDFDSSQLLNSDVNKFFLFIERNRDLKKINLFFNTNLLTYNQVKSDLASGNYPAASILYAPVYFGFGLKAGQIWDRTSGFGRWNFILKDIFSGLCNKSILSLGCNNASIELFMLRNGALNITAYEENIEYLNQAKYFLRIAEWIDNKKYNITFINRNFYNASKLKKKFDLTIALCSLYYLSEPKMFKLTKHLKKISKQLILQCNTQENIGRERDDDYRRASVEFASEMLISLNFKHLKTIAPLLYSRPLVIGTK